MYFHIVLVVDVLLCSSCYSWYSCKIRLRGCNEDLIAFYQQKDNLDSCHYYFLAKERSRMMFGAR